MLDGSTAVDSKRMVLHEIVALAPHARTVTVVAVTKADGPACTPRFAGMHDPRVRMCRLEYGSRRVAFCFE